MQRMWPSDISKATRPSPCYHLGRWLGDDHSCLHKLNRVTVPPVQRRTLKGENSVAGIIMERVDKAEIRYKRNLMIVRLRKEEMTNNEVSKIVGLCPSRVSTIWSKYKKGGPDALRITKWGRGKGEKRKLSPAQEREVINLLLGKPKRVVVGLGFSLWSKDAIREAVWQKFQIVSVRKRHFSELRGDKDVRNAPKSLRAC